MGREEIPTWIRKMDDDELKSEAEGLHESIYVVGCYGAKDILFLDAMLAELEYRGFTVEEETSLFIDREEPDEDEEDEDE